MHEAKKSLGRCETIAKQLSDASLELESCR
jgi:hypothetical protein